MITIILVLALVWRIVVVFSPQASVKDVTQKVYNLDFSGESKRFSGSLPSFDFSSIDVRRILYGLAILLFITIAVSFYSKAFEDGTSVPTRSYKQYGRIISGANLRSEPSAQGDLILEIPANAEVRLLNCLINEGGGNWCKVRYNGYTGYCTSEPRYMEKFTKYE